MTLGMCASTLTLSHVIVSVMEIVAGVIVVFESLRSRKAEKRRAVQDFRVTGRLTGFAGAAVSYVGDRVGTFMATSERQILPAYTQANLRAGMMYDSWTANLFVTNPAESRGVLAGGLDRVPTNSFIYTQPRTVGLAISRTFCDC
jgi:hypothetical protein